MQRELKNFWEVQSLKPSCNKTTAKFLGMALARLYRNVAKTMSKYIAYTEKKRVRIQKDTFNSPYIVCGTGEVYKCAQIWVSALFSAFLRCFEPRELAKLVGLQNLFRDLGFFFSFLKTFSPSQVKGRVPGRVRGRIGNVEEHRRREWKCIKTLLLRFYWNYLWLMCQLFRVMCDLHSFTPTNQACGLERLHLQGRGDRAGGITSSAQHKALSLSKVFHVLKRQHTVFKDKTLKVKLSSIVLQSLLGKSCLIHLYVPVAVANNTVY